MKPCKSLMFLAGVLALLYGFRLLQNECGGRGHQSLDIPHDNIARQENQPFLGLEDSLIQIYRSIYRLPEQNPNQERLQGIPIVAFEYDSAGRGSLLLENFFIKLLEISHPDQTNRLQHWYPEPFAWNGGFSEKRPSFSRILYYGDASIQNDRISGTLRQLLQTDFGGFGPGILPLSSLIPCDPKENGRQCAIRKEGAWQEISAVSSMRQGNYGILSSYLSAPLYQASPPSRQETGTVRIELPLFLQHHDGLCLEVFAHKDVLANDIHVSVQKKPSSDREPVPTASTLTGPGQKRFTYALPRDFQNISFQMKFKRNRNLYALALNDTTGICVDNLCLPESKGKVFSVNNRRFLTDQLDLANAGLILYQFGYQLPAPIDSSRTEETCRQFRFQLLQELSYIRSLMPATPVIVVGVSDFSEHFGASTAFSGHRPERELSSEALRQIQKEAAFQTDCVFWNPSRALSEACPPTIDKADLTALLFYQALMDAYRLFLKKELRTMSLQRAKSLELNTYSRQSR